MSLIKPELPEEEDSFFVSWSDLVTLLLVFFVYLFSISEINPNKFFEAKTSMNHAMGPSDQFDRLKEFEEFQSNLKQSFAELQKLIQEESLEDVISVSYLDNQLEINVGNQILFDLGSVELKSEAQVVLKDLVHVLQGSDNQIIVEGHTDNTPIQSKQYPSNWELSAARASQVVRFFIANDMHKRRFLVVGKASNSPLAANDTAENRARNRRIKIVVKPS